jgi:RimJ/RimL family protein N-acetyltransferase
MTGLPSGKCQLRPARPDDEGPFLEWRNSDWSIALSGTQRAVTPEEHGQWFSETLGGAIRRLFVIEEQGAAVGMIRYEVAGEASLEVTLAVVPERLGEGLGTAAFRESLPLVAAWRPPRTIVARVRRSNSRSLAFFRHLGFVMVEDDGKSALVRLELAVGETADTEP